MPRHRRGWAMGSDMEMEARHSPVMAAMLEPVVLTLLMEDPRHGYTLLSDLAKMGMSTIHPSMIYRILRDMEELGWIISDWETDQTQGPPRRTYRLTALGNDILANWMKELEKTQQTIAQLLAMWNQNERST